MPKSGSEVSDDFEFIETPAAPTPVPPPEDYGVRTTTVRPRHSKNALRNTLWVPNWAVQVPNSSIANSDSLVSINQECTSPCRLIKQRQFL